MRFSREEHARSRRIRHNKHNSTVPLPLRSRIPLCRPPTPTRYNANDNGLWFPRRISQLNALSIRSHLRHEFLRTLQGLQVCRCRPIISSLRTQFRRLLPPTLLRHTKGRIPLTLNRQAPCLCLSKLTRRRLNSSKDPTPNNARHMYRRPQLPLRRAPTLRRCQLSKLRFIINVSTKIRLLLRL